jgi:hypothetical protein
MKKKDIKKVHLMEHHSLAVKTEIYKFSYRNNFTIHPNTIEYLDMDIKDLTNWMIDNSISLVMGEEEYNDRIMVNSSLKLDFEELYNDKNALIQVVILPYHIPTLEDIAEEVGADIVNVTKGVNGYPMGLHRAITFDDDSFDWLDIEDIANIHNLEIVALHKRDGWNLWEKHYNANTPFNLTENMFGDNAVCWTDEGCFIEDLLERINGNCITNFDDLKDIIDDAEEIISHLRYIDDNEQVLCIDHRFYEIIKKETLAYNYDTHYYQIALIEKEK